MGFDVSRPTFWRVAPWRVGGRDVICDVREGSVQEALAIPFSKSTEPAAKRSRIGDVRRA